MLSISGLTKQFGDKIAVDAANIQIHEPAMIGIIGRSGAGKSTLLRMLNRLSDVSSGKILFEGEDVTAMRGAARRQWQSRCAMIFQQFNLVPRMDVVSNVLHGTLNRRSTIATMFNLYPQSDIHKAIDILNRLGIAEQAPKRAEALSGGQQQRVAIARALMQDPAIILADEPIASLDPMNAQVVMQSLRDIHEEDGRMVIANLHTLDTARIFPKPPHQPKSKRWTGLTRQKSRSSPEPVHLRQKGASFLHGDTDEKAYRCRVGNFGLGHPYICTRNHRIPYRHPWW